MWAVLGKILLTGLSFKKTLFYFARKCKSVKIFRDKVEDLAKGQLLQLKM